MKVLSLVLAIVALNCKPMAAENAVDYKKLIMAVLEPYLEGLPLDTMLQAFGDNVDQMKLTLFDRKYRDHRGDESSESTEDHLSMTKELNAFSDVLEDAMSKIKIFNGTADEAFRLIEEKVEEDTELDKEMENIAKFFSSKIVAIEREDPDYMEFWKPLVTQMVVKVATQVFKELPVTVKHALKYMEPYDKKSTSIPKMTGTVKIEPYNYIEA